MKKIYKYIFLIIVIILIALIGFIIKTKNIKEVAMPVSTSAPVLKQNEQNAEKLSGAEYKAGMKAKLEKIDMDRSEADYGETTLQMIETEGEFFEKYDVILNEIYQYLKNSMTESEFIKLRDVQRKWIADKERRINEIYQEDGTIARIDAVSYNVTITRERCYELLEYIK